MSQNKYNTITGIIFIIIAAVHLVRSILGWNVAVGSVSIPVGVSVVAFLLASFLAYTALWKKKNDQ